MNKEDSLKELDFDLSLEELNDLEKSSKSIGCEGGGEGWSG